MIPVSRRSLMSATGAAAGMLLTGACSDATAHGGAEPHGAQSSPPPPAKALAAVADLSKVPTETVDPATGEPAFLVKDTGRVAMLSAICTHMGCTVAWDPGTDQFACPCHGAVYDSSGDVVSGPAPQRLARLKIRVRQGEVYRA